jgi:tol-pal system protein YbgF
MLRGAIFALAVSLSGAVPFGAASAETLADVKQDLAVLSVELQKLKRELSTTGSPSVQVGGDVLQRVNIIESELMRLTSKTEELEHRIGRVAEDGANRLDDLQFRVCEMEEGCDFGTLQSVPPLGGEVVATPAAPIAPATDALPIEGELAVSEEADFRSAQEALDKGDYTAASQLFAQFRQNYPMGPLEAAALVGEGRGLEGLGDTREAARRYLDAYSNYPDSQVAAEALWRLGATLGALGSVPEACVTLAEVSKRYPGSEFVSQAAQSRSGLACQ